MIELYKVKAVACATLAVLTGMSVLGMAWAALFIPWPTTIGLVIATILQMALLTYFIGNITYARIHADIKTLEEKNT